MKKRPESLRVGTSQIPLWERALSLFTVIMLSGAFVPLIREQTGHVDPTIQSGDPFFRAILALCYVAIAAVFVFRWEQLKVNVLSRNMLLYLLLFEALASLLWSTAPSAFVVRRFLALAGTTVAGLYLAVRYDRQGLLLMLTVALGINVVMSYIFGLFIPNWGLMPVFGYSHEVWRGVFSNKNALGRMMVLSLTVFMTYPKKSKISKALAVGLVVLTLGLVVMSGSATSLVLSSLLILLWIHLHVVMRINQHLLRAAYRAFVLALLVLLSGEVYWHFNIIFNALGRSATLTGRTKIWAVLIKMIPTHLWFGYGYSSFFTGSSGPSGVVWSYLGFDPISAHNGPLGLVLELGFIGLIIFTLGLLSSIKRSITWVLMYAGEENLWPILYLVFMVLYNIDESTIMTENSLYWCLYVTVFTLVRSPSTQSSQVAVYKTSSVGVTDLMRLEESW